VSELFHVLFGAVSDGTKRRDFLLREEPQTARLHRWADASGGGAL